MDLSSMTVHDQLDLVLKLAGLTGAAVGFFMGLSQYRKAQRWKVTEFVGNEIELMKRNQSVRAALFMLDWSKRKIELFPDREDREKRWAVVTHDNVIAALQPHDERTAFSTEESRIRDIFDDYLDALVRLQQFIVAGLVEADELRPYLRYWITIIADPKRLVRASDGVPALWKYIEFYKDAYEDVQKLMERFGHPISSPHWNAKTVAPQASEAPAESASG